MGRQSAIVLYATVVGAVAAFVGFAPDAPSWLAAGVVALALAAAGAILAMSRRSPANRTGANHQAEVSSLRQELEFSRHHYQQLFDIVPCYITIHDRDFNILESNRLFREDFGELRPNDTCYNAYKGLDEACPDCPVHKTFADGKVHSSEEKVVTRDGREAAMIVYSMPVRDEEGEITAVMEVATNITQVKALQRQLAMVGLAVTGMAHRIKNVLMGLEGGIFVVNSGFEDNDPETLKKGWDMVQRNVGRIGAIAHDLLFCSKERAPKLEPGVAPAAVARDAVALFASRAEREGITLRLETNNNSRGVYDPEALHKLFSNLIANAIDACRFDPEVEQKQHEILVRCAEDSSGATVVQVRDNGAGIAKEDSPKVFEGFFSSKGTEGTGLGLFVVQKVVEQHEGEITFESREGAGTAFTAVLRSQDSSLAVPESSEVNPRAPPPPPP
jgi:signal transduction histidine kinase